MVKAIFQAIFFLLSQAPVHPLNHFLKRIKTYKLEILTDYKSHCLSQVRRGDHLRFERPLRGAAESDEAGHHGLRDPTAEG